MHRFFAVVTEDHAWFVAVVTEDHAWFVAVVTESHAWFVAVVTEDHAGADGSVAHLRVGRHQLRRLLHQEQRQRLPADRQASFLHGGSQGLQLPAHRPLQPGLRN